FFDVEDGYIARVFGSGLTFGLIGQDEEVTQRTTARYESGGNTVEQSYDYLHTIGVGTMSGSVAKLEGDDLGEMTAIREMVRRVVDGFLVELDQRGVLQ
ncbi:MAG: hypothetical protein AAGK78_08875, partial [Planctomycetota bacterium]